VSSRADFGDVAKEPAAGEANNDQGLTWGEGLTTFELGLRDISLRILGRWEYLVYKRVTTMKPCVSFSAAVALVFRLTLLNGTMDLTAIEDDWRSLCSRREEPSFRTPPADSYFYPPFLQSSPNRTASCWGLDDHDRISRPTMKALISAYLAEAEQRLSPTGTADEPAFASATRNEQTDHDPPIPTAETCYSPLTYREDLNEDDVSPNKASEKSPQPSNGRLVVRIRCPQGMFRISLKSSSSLLDLKRAIEADKRLGVSLSLQRLAFDHRGDKPLRPKRLCETRASDSELLLSDCGIESGDIVHLLYEDS